MKVSKNVYDTILDDIEYEKENSEANDYSRKSRLNDKAFKAFGCYAQIINIDDPDQTRTVTTRDTK